MNKKDPEYLATVQRKQNMDLWNSLAQSDLKYLKKVSFGQRSFTSIDPQYQIMKMTKIFGPVGVGWGYNAEYDYPSANDMILIVAKVTIWTKIPENTFGPIAGSRTFWHKDMKRPAEDAGKMALTDALTKGLSHLGCDADVFLGKHDNKYNADNGKTDNNPF
tara:strand:- start:1104 stop:1589 length:486 start_codon:yes stop_codon:yes gene_type:complete